MRTQVGGVPVEITRPESAKFRHPLLLVHGLWTASWVWEPLATYLAHRGWESWAPSLLGVADAPARTRVLEEVIRSFSEPPVVITHDAGLTVAAPLAANRAVAAIAALAPLLGPSAGSGRRGLFAWPQFWLPRLFGASVPPPRGAGAQAYLGRAVASLDRLRPDSASFFRTLASGNVDLPTATEVAGMVIVGAEDAIVSEPDARDVAARLGWGQRTLPARGHFALLEADWETLADEVHRWIVRTLGADLLLFLEDDPGADPL